MKRIYSNDEGKTPARRALEQEVLLNLRALRRRMTQQHPGLLEEIQSRYQAAQKPPISAPVEDIIPIDRKKNMETVALFLKLRGMNPQDLLN